MNLEKQDVQRAVERFHVPEPAFQRLLDRRAHRLRAERLRAGALAFVILLAVGALLTRTDRTTDPFRPVPAPEWGRADVEGAVFTNPGGWHLTGHFKGAAQTITLANFASDLTTTDPCGDVPADGARLLIDPHAAGSAPPWPVLLTGGAARARCGEPALSARWSVGGRTFAAEATFGPAVSDADRARLRHAFTDLQFVARGDGTNSSTSCFTGQDFGVMVGEVIGADTTGPLPWTMYAARGSRCAPAGGVLVAGADEGYAFVAPIPSSDPASGLHVSDTKFGAHSYVGGVVGKDVDHVTLRTVDGSVADAALVPTDPLLPDAKVFFAAFAGYPQGVVTTYDADGVALRTSRYWPAMDCSQYPAACVGQAGVIAGGTADGTGWRLVERDQSIQVVDDRGKIVASVPIGSGSLEVSRGPIGDSQEVVFGVAPPGSALAIARLPGVGFMPAQARQLQDGTVAFWVQWVAGEIDLVAATDGSCMPIAAVAVRSGASAELPTLATCRDTNG
jgi:hypothetical protein